MPEGALAGIRVIELGGQVSAPYAAKLFADYGADVIKVEPPGSGEPARRWGPFPKDEPHPEKSGLFQFLNTNKRGITLDLGSEGGRASLRRLLEGADVLIENLSSERIRDWGLEYATLAKLNPDLVVISITPFGRTGPYSRWKGYDLNAFHLSATGSRYCGLPGQAPLEHGTFSADFYGAVTAAAWGLAATLGRDRTGGGQHLDVSCAEAIAATFVGGQNIGGYAQDGVFEKRTGVGMPLGAPATIMPCKNGHVWILALEPGQWNGLARAMGSPDWAGLEMFQDMFTRAQNSDAIYPLIEEWTLQHDKWEIMETCQAHGVPVTAIFTIEEAANHPHLAERGYLIELEHAALGRIRTLGPPFKLPRSPGGPRRAAPLLGEHDDAIVGRETAEWAPRARTANDEAAGTPGARPLEGLRIANFGWVWAGPVVGQTLSFLGAEVYKIESRARVDMTRGLPPFGGGVRDPDRSLSNHACWAGNGSVTLNLKKPEARELALELIARCDAVIENFGPGVMDGLGLGYEALCKRKPDLVLFSMPAAGLFGPLKDIRTYGLSLTSLTGLDSLTGYTGGPPIPMENAFSDPYNGILGAFAILVALRHRDRTGEGQHIDYSQQEAVMQMVGPAFMDHVLNGRSAGPMGNRHPLHAAAPHGVFRCAGDDRWVSIAVLTDAEWAGLVQAMGEPEWARRPELEGLAGRLHELDSIHRKLEAWTAGFEDLELAERLQSHGVAAAPVLNVADLLESPHYRARGTFLEVDHPLGFRETLYGAYVKMSHSRIQVRPGPMMGQDNEAVFRDLLEIPEPRYRQLIEDQVIY